MAFKDALSAFAVIIMSDMALSVRRSGSCFNGDCGWQAHLRTAFATASALLPG